MQCPMNYRCLPVRLVGTGTIAHSMFKGPSSVPPLLYSVLLNSIFLVLPGLSNPAPLQEALGSAKALLPLLLPGNCLGEVCQCQAGPTILVSSPSEISFLHCANDH